MLFELLKHHILDRFVIRQHLLNYPTDPFNQQHLTEETLVPVTDLNDRIDFYKIRRINLNKKSLSIVSPVRKYYGLDVSVDIV